MKYLSYVAGILILTLGIAFTIQSDIGTSPFDALLVGLSSEVGLTVGSWELIIAVILLICNSILTKERPVVLGLLTAFFTGIGIDFWLFLLDKIVTPELWFSKAVCFGIGLIFIGFGTAIYLHTHVAPTPIDKLTLIIQEMTKKSIFIARTVIYAVFLFLAMIVHGPIGIGTLLTVCFGGILLNFFMPLAGKMLKAVHAE